MGLNQLNRPAVLSRLGTPLVIGLGCAVVFLILFAMLAEEMLEGDTRQFDDTVRLFVHAQFIHGTHRHYAVSVGGWFSAGRHPHRHRGLYCTMDRRPSPPGNPDCSHRRGRRPSDVGTQNRLSPAPPCALFRYQASGVLQLSQRTRNAFVLPLPFRSSSVFGESEEPTGSRSYLDFLGESFRGNRLFADLPGCPLPERCNRRVSRGACLVTCSGKRISEVA